MGRHKTYDRDDVARKAMDLFWRQGFHGTSTDELARHMGLNKFSLFAEFSSKQGLFEAAMALYEREVVTGHFAALEQKGAGLDEVQGVLRFFAAHADDAGRGCFLCNVATERAPHDPASREAVDAYLTRITAALDNALRQAKRAGALRPDVRVRDEARFIASTLLGFWVLMRAGADPALVRGAARAAVEHLEQLRAPTTTSS